VGLTWRSEQRMTCTANGFGSQMRHFHLTASSICFIMSLLKLFYISQSEYRKNGISQS